MGVCLFDDENLRLRELEHRFRNILTVVRSIVSQTLHSARSLEDARAMVDARLGSLGGAIDTLLESQWGPTPLGAMVEQTFTHFAAYRGRYRCDGPAVTIGAGAVMTMMLVLHELATNAIKYSALSNEEGTVDVSWRVTGEGSYAELWLQWAERGGPPVTRPSRQGFGSRLIDTVASKSFRGRCELDFAPSGLRWTLVVPLEAIGA